MPASTEKELFCNEAFRLSSDRLSQGDSEVWLDGSTLCIMRGGKLREVKIAPLPAYMPHYHGPIPVLSAMYNLAGQEMQENLLPDGLLKAGKSWTSVWTRDIAYSVLLGAVLSMPEACRASLESRVKDGLIMQDTGTGGGWPVSTDRVSWSSAAWHYYYITGDREWLAWAAEIIKATHAQDEALLTRSETGIFPGETSFIDWREQSYPDWMSPADIGASQAFGTNVLHVMSRRALARMSAELGQAEQAQALAAQASQLSEAVNRHFWCRATNQYGILSTADGHLDSRSDALASSLALLSGLSGTHSEASMQNLPRSSFGSPVFSPYKSHLGCYHNRSIWPFTEAFVLMAQAERQDLHGMEASMAYILRSALLFGSNKENLDAITGEACDSMQNSNAQLWSAAGMQGMFYHGLFGMQYEQDNLVFNPCIPKAYAGSHWLTGLKIRGMVIDIHINGYGNELCKAMINGRMSTPFLPLESKGHFVIEMELQPSDDENSSNVARPLTIGDLREPLWDKPSRKLLSWLPVEGALMYRVYRAGEVITQTAACQYAISATEVYASYRIQAICDKKQSCLGEPFEAIPEGAQHILQPSNIGEQGEHQVEQGQAWLNTDPSTRKLIYESISLPAGRYSLRWNYCNASNTKRDGDSCALRRLYRGEEACGLVVLPQCGEAGEWEKFGLTAASILELNEGEHCFSLQYEASCNKGGSVNQSMLRELILTKID